MNIKTLLSLEIGASVSIFNEPFTYVGRTDITLDGDKELVWLNDEEHLFCIVPDDEELILFRMIEEEIEPDDEMVLYQNKEYEFSYEDAGAVTEVTGDTDTEEGDRYMFSDYTAQDGRVIRLLSNENTGEMIAYIGQVVSEDDLSEIEI
jgi:hypothetical protein